MSTFFERLREERQRLGLNQTEFAELAGVQKRAQVNYESGDRSPDAAYLSAIADAGADVLYILRGHRDPDVPALDAAEQVLLDSYRRCSPDAKANLIKTAALLSAGLAPAAPQRSSPTKGTTIRQHNVGDNAVQVGQAGGKVKISK